MSSQPEPETSRDEREPHAVDAPSPEAALYAALAAAQAKFPPITKNRTGEVRGRNKDGQAYSYSYSYADLGDVLAAVRPVLGGHGLAVVQRTTRLDNAGKVLLVTELHHSAGGVIDSEVELGQTSSNPQAFGGALTYLRRYELTTLLGVAAEEDRDAQDVPVAEPGGRTVLPDWAGPASDDDKAKLLEVLEKMLGHRGTAVEYAKALAQRSGGQFPAVVARWLAAFPTWLEAAPANRAREEELAADAARQAQDAGAEAPDTPPSEGVDAEPTDDPPPPADELGAPADRPPAGTVDVYPTEPALETIRAALEGADVDAAELSQARELVADELRQAGCICPDPIAVTLDPKAPVNDACPIRGHGIPF